MVQRAAALGASVTALFVTSDETLRREVSSAAKRSHFVSTPDILVTGLNQVSGGATV